MAQNHRKMLLESNFLLTEDEVKRLDMQDKQLNKIKGELQSMAHERAILDVYTRQTISEAKRAGVRGVPAGRPNYEATKSVPTAPRATSSRTTERTSKMGVTQDKRIVTHNNTSETLAIDLTGTIHIPEYIPRYMREKESNNIKNTMRKNDINYPVVSQIPAHKIARAVGNGIMVPSMRVGSLPVELKDIRTVPTEQSNIKTVRQKSKRYLNSLIL